MNKEKTKNIKFGNPGFFLSLTTALVIMSLFSAGGAGGAGGGTNRLKALVTIISIFGSGIVAITGLTMSIIHWNRLSLLGKLSFYLLLGFIILIGFMLIPAL